MKNTVFAILMIFCLLVPVGTQIVFAEESHAEKGAGHEESIWQAIGKWVNLAALVWILYYFLGKKLRVQDKFKTEADEIKNAIESARQAKEEAEKRLQEMEQKMVQLNEDAARIRAEAATQAEEQKKRILDSAQKEAERIIEQAHREVDVEVVHARKELRKHIAELAVTQGQKIIEEEINEQDQRNLVRQYIENFGK